MDKQPQIDGKSVEEWSVWKRAKVNKEDKELHIRSIKRAIFMYIPGFFVFCIILYSITEGIKHLLAG